MKLLLASSPLLRRRVRQAAATLPATMMVVVIISGLLAVSATVTSQFGRYAGRQQGVGMEAAFCDAVLEYAYAQWKYKVSYNVYKTAGAGTPPNASTIVPSTYQTDFAAAFPYADQLGIDSTGATTKWTLTIQAVDQNGQNNQTMDTASSSTVLKSPTTDVTASDGAPPYVLTKTVPNYPGWIGYNYTYMATVTLSSTHYGIESQPYTARRYFQVTKMPLCQGLGFYEGNMEIHPGATMVLTGAIHSNKNIWAQGYGAYLQFKNNVSYVGSFYDGSSNPSVTKGWDGSNTGANNPDVYVSYFPNLYSDGLPKKATPYAQGVPAAITGTTATSAQALAASSAYGTQVNQVAPIDPFGGASTNNNGLHDIVEVPDATTTSTQIAYNNAALVVEVNSTGAVNNKILPTNISVQVRDATTNLLVPALPTSTDYQNVVAAINNGVTTPVYDKRELATVVMTNLDMNLLNNATTMPNNGKATPLQTAFNQNGTHGGTVYIHDKAADTATKEPAIRLVNGRDIGQNVSIATDNGLYIQGDYNTGGGNGTNAYLNVPTNKSGSTSTDLPQAPGYTRYASAVMADAVTILSNNWNDANASTALSTRTAYPTTVNVAILAGDVASNTGSNGIASGGLHNFPRFLENWNNVNFTYYGSLIEAYNSQQAVGNWQTNDVYHWPNRLWNFDTNYLTTQPPGLPQGVIFSRGRWERNYSAGANYQG